MQHVKAICLDLDDTLWDLEPVISRAEEAVYAWLATSYPRVTERFSLEDIRALRQAMVEDHPGQEYDLSLLRRATFARLAREAGYPPAMVSEAFVVFQRVRNGVDLYDDVRPALARLTRRRRVFALTNGNADLGVIGLRHYFDEVFTAAELGAAKPDPVVFRAVCERTGLEPHQVLHAGDNPEKDVAAARAAGMPAVWVNRRARAWPLGVAPPEHQVRDLHELADLCGA
jgi:putative hydrolase of the HAD superfamily